MVSFDEIIDKANVKELIAMVVGLVGSRMADGLLSGYDAKTRDIIKVGGGLVATYFLNDMAGKYPGREELTALAGLAATAFAAAPIAGRISIQVARSTGMPIRVTGKSPSANPPQSVAATARKSAVVSI